MGKKEAAERGIFSAYKYMWQAAATNTFLPAVEGGFFPNGSGRGEGVEAGRSS
jgi:hypothetical protein